MFCKNCGKEIKDEAEFCPYCGEKIRQMKENKNIVTPNKKTKKLMLKKGWLWLGVIAIVLVTVIFGGEHFKKEYKKDNKDEIIKKLQQFTFVAQRQDGYHFFYNDSWDIKYTKENEMVDIMEEDVYDFFQSYTGEGYFANAGHFIYDLNENAIRMYFKYKTDKGTLSLINYDIDDDEFMVMMDEEKYEASDELISFIKKHGIIDTMKDDIEEFKNTLKSNGLTVQQVTDLRYKDIESFNDLDLESNTADMIDYSMDKVDEDTKNNTKDNHSKENSVTLNEAKEDSKTNEKDISSKEYKDYKIGFLLENPGLTNNEKVRIYGNFTSRHEIYIQDENNTIEVKYDKSAYDDAGNDVGRVTTGENGYVEGTYIMGDNPYIQADKIILTDNLPDSIAQGNNQDLEEGYNFIGVEGVYNDFTHGSAYSSEIYVYISDITDDTFWFVIFNGDDPIFAHNMAEITGDNTAVFTGEQYTLNFTWNGNAELTVTGFSQVEDMIFINNSYLQVS